MKHACVHFFTSTAKYWTIQNTSNSIQFQHVFWCLCTLSGGNHWRVANLRYWGQSQSWTQMPYSVLYIGRHCLFFFVWRMMVYSNSQLKWKKKHVKPSRKSSMDDSLKTSTLPIWVQHLSKALEGPSKLYSCCVPTMHLTVRLLNTCRSIRAARHPLFNIWSECVCIMYQHMLTHY